MRKLIICMHVSLDGFVAGPEGEMDWILADEELFDNTSAITEGADTALYGRVTWQMMDGYWPTAADQPNASKHDIEHARWYNNVTKVVISRTMSAIDRPRTRVIGASFQDEMKALKEEPGGHILMFGSPSAVHSLLQYGLIDEYWLFVNPILLGAGITLFRNIDDRIPLKLLSVNALSSGVVGLHYQQRG